MAKTIELTMSLPYCGNWGVPEGCREIVANAMDAERCVGAKMTVEYDEGTRSLSVTTDGCKLEPRTLLLGISEKGGGNAVGRHGEGYKVGILALLRSGKSVVIYTGDQIWTPHLKRSETFGETVLAFDIRASRKKTTSIRVVISGISPEEWEEMRNNFRFKCEESAEDVMKTKLIPYYSGDERGDEATVLKRLALKGKIFVGGIYVCEDKSLSYGYDLPPSKVELSRDRNGIASWELRSILAHVWQSLFVDAVAEKDDESIDLLFKLAGKNAPDVAGVEDSSRAPFVQAIGLNFDMMHGAASIPVDSIAEAHRAEAIGLKAVFVPSMIKKILGRGVGGPRATLEQKEKERATAVTRSFGESELSVEEQAMLLWAWGATSMAGARVSMGIEEKILVRPPLVVEFGSEAILGLHSTDSTTGDRLVMVARRLLSRAKAGPLLVTLVHEWAHHHHAEHGAGLLSIEEKMMEHIIDHFAEKLLG